MITESDVQRAIRQIERMILDGWSIPYARKKCCGGDNNPLCRAVRKNDSYLKILNHYMSTMKNGHQFSRDNRGNLNPVRKDGK